MIYIPVLQTLQKPDMLIHTRVKQSEEMSILPIHGKFQICRSVKWKFTFEKLMTRTRTSLVQSNKIRFGFKKIALPILAQWSYLKSKFSSCRKSREVICWGRWRIIIFLVLKFTLIRLVSENHTKYVSLVKNSHVFLLYLFPPFLFSHTYHVIKLFKILDIFF